MSKYSTYEVFEINNKTKETGRLEFTTYEKARDYICNRAMFLSNISSLRFFEIELSLVRFDYGNNGIVDNTEQLRSLKLISS
jgi:hypothetical protein